MITMLIPWITFWIAVSINTALGTVITILVCALIPLIMRKHDIVIWDRLSFAAVTLLSVAAYISGDGDLVTNIGYLVFGFLWLGSCVVKEPLCATYVKYNYGGDSA